jgi:hypothetical protein
VYTGDFDEKEEKLDEAIELLKEQLKDLVVSHRKN